MGMTGCGHAHFIFLIVIINAAVVNKILMRLLRSTMKESCLIQHAYKQERIMGEYARAGSADGMAQDCFSGQLFAF